MSSDYDDRRALFQRELRSLVSKYQVGLRAIIKYKKENGVITAASPDILIVDEQELYKSVASNDAKPKKRVN